MGATRPHNPAARGEPLGATAPWQNRSQPKKNKPTLNTKLRILPCYEAGCFGYQPARRMQKLGVKVYVIAPQNWDEQGKGQVNDKHDAQVICRRLSEYLAGHEKALSIVRIPSPQEEERRARGRLREQLQRELRRVQAIRRSLLLNWEMPVRGRWWRQLSWPGMVKAIPKWVIQQLESWKPIAEAIEEQLGKKLKPSCARGPRAS